MGHLNLSINGNQNIVVTDKRCWKQYSKDSIGSLKANKHLLFYCGTAALTAITLSTSVMITRNDDSDNKPLSFP